MTLDLNLHEEFFLKTADTVVADLLRQLGKKWGGEEQVDDDIEEDNIKKRFFLGYEFPTEEIHGHVWMDFWIGGMGKIHVEREGHAIFIDLAPMDYQCAHIDIAFHPDMGEDFVIDNEHRVHSGGELKDRINVMWNIDHWKINHEYLDYNANLHRKFISHENYFKENVRPVTAILKKLGTAWGGEEQMDNTPDPDDEKGGGLFGVKKGKKRYFVGLSSPALRLDGQGKAGITKAAAWVDLWNGKKGVLKKSSSSRHLELKDPTHKQIRIVFSQDKPVMAVVGIQDAQAQSGKEMQALLGNLWKRDAFGLKE